MSSAKIILKKLAFNALWRYIPVSLPFATSKNEFRSATRLWGLVNFCTPQEMNQRVLPRHARSVEWIDVKVRLSEEFGRSRSQTIHFTPDGHNILDLNAKVHAPLIKIVNGWNIANA